MSLDYRYMLLLASLLILLSVLASRFAARLGISSLLATLGIGILIGNGGKYDFNYDFPELTLHISEVALCFIIFTGGINSNWKGLRPILGKGLSLATIGVLCTSLSVGLIVYLLFDWPFLAALLLGAIVSSTDAAAVFSILDSTGLKLKNSLGEILELESGTNDPMAYFLTISFSFLLVQPDAGVLQLSLNFLISMSVGLVTGIVCGKLGNYIIIHSKLKKGQTPVLLLALVLLLYAVNSLLGGSPFLAVYLAGLLISQSHWTNKPISIFFFEGFSWLMETALFLILGLQVYIFEIMDVFWEGLLLSFVLILLARPVGVYISLIFFKDLDWKQKSFVSWVGLRGATPIVFALIPLVNQIGVARELFNVSFIIVITSILLQGTTVKYIALLTDSSTVKA
ncbi:cell volume regulation protein A [Catalinimonas alkaloidigena]|uniref:potassium/proton antiporter n=1 Tax=Catalinimonas alkaloidigena TaxID=1075417 RepID=UPI00240551A3|nr:potassium/proton antiporter [Catalinimonas alkaloidigena]MDF9798176.1 cell volume regulation protein A [Catalinimonas alkaloidigena]